LSAHSLTAQARQGKYEDILNGDARYAFICDDGQEAIDLNKATFGDLGARLAGYPVQNSNFARAPVSKH